MRRREKKTLWLLAGALALLLAVIPLAAAKAEMKPTPYVAIQLAASEQLARCFEAVRGYKEERGVPMAAEDIHHTGMIGRAYTGITTTMGDVEAKRTTACPDMAALCVRLLHEAGVREGDAVGAGFSGSFPAMNLALVAACESMKVRLVCIASVGASTYGANDPELTFPEMLWLLKRDGLIQTESAAVTMGGYNDVGGDMEPALAEDIRMRLAGAGMTLLNEPDFAKNILARERIYEASGPIVCFVAVGGNVTSMGEGESGLSLGQGVLHTVQTPPLRDESGLVQRYLSRGIPVVNILHIKKLVLEYGMPYDPPRWTPTGENPVYRSVEYPKAVLLAGILGVLALLLACRFAAKRSDEEKEWQEWLKKL